MTVTHTCTDRNNTHPTVKSSLSAVATGDDEAIGFGTGRGPGRAKDFPGFLLLKYIV